MCASVIPLFSLQDLISPLFMYFFMLYFALSSQPSDDEYVVKSNNTIKLSFKVKFFRNVDS